MTPTQAMINQGHQTVPETRPAPVTFASINDTLLDCNRMLVVIGERKIALENRVAELERELAAAEAENKRVAAELAGLLLTPATTVATIVET